MGCTCFTGPLHSNAEIRSDFLPLGPDAMRPQMSASGQGVWPEGIIIRVCESSTKPINTAAIRRNRQSANTTRQIYSEKQGSTTVPGRPQNNSSKPGSFGAIKAGGSQSQWFRSFGAPRRPDWPVFFYRTPSHDPQAQAKMGTKKRVCSVISCSLLCPEA